MQSAGVTNILNFCCVLLWRGRCPWNFNWMVTECKYMKHIFELRMKDQIEERSSQLLPSSETQGQIVGPKTKIKTGGNKFDEQKYERKIRAPGDKLFTHQFQTAERILAPDWAENFSAQSGASTPSAVWNWCVKSLSPRARIFLSYFCSSNLFPPVLIFVFGPTICPWVSEDELLRNLSSCEKKAWKNKITGTKLDCCVIRCPRWPKTLCPTFIQFLASRYLHIWISRYISGIRTYRPTSRITLQNTENSRRHHHHHHHHHHHELRSIAHRHVL